MTTTLEQTETRLPAISPSKAAALCEALNIPDVTGIDLDKFDDESLVEFAYAIREQRHKATMMFAALCENVDVAILQAQEKIKARITDNGGTDLAHDRFNVRIEQKMERDKRIDVLRRLEGILPDDLYHQAVRVKKISGNLNQAIVSIALQTGASVEWDADLRKLDVHARKYGPESEIAKIIEEGSPRVAIGAPKLVIEPRESALKAAV